MNYTKQFEPKTPDELCGQVQRQVANKLVTQAKNGSISNLILFTGNTGVGKTTISKMVAKELGSYDHHSCANLNIDDIRQIFSDSVFAPFGGYTVHFFDEVDALTDKQQRALLVDIENLPSHFICIFATLTPEKLRDDLRGRLRENTYHLPNPSLGEIRDYMLKVLGEKGITIGNGITKEQANSIYKLGNGDMRSTIGLIGKFIETGIVDETETSEQTESLIRLLLNGGSVQDVLKAIDTSKPYESQRIGLLSYCVKVLSGGHNEMAIKIIRAFEAPLESPEYLSFQIRLIKVLTND